MKNMKFLLIKQTLHLLRVLHGESFFILLEIRNRFSTMKSMKFRKFFLIKKLFVFFMSFMVIFFISEYPPA